MRIAVIGAGAMGCLFGGLLAEAGQDVAMPLQDVLAGRPTEIDTINGAVVDRGEAVGVDTPVTRTLRDLVRLRESR